MQLIYCYSKLLPEIGNSCSIMGLWSFRWLKSSKKWKIDSTDSYEVKLDWSHRWCPSNIFSFWTLSATLGNKLNAAAVGVVMVWGLNNERRKIISVTCIVKVHYGTGALISTLLTHRSPRILLRLSGFCNKMRYKWELASITEFWKVLGAFDSLTTTQSHWPYPAWTQILDFSS